MCHKKEHKVNTEDNEHANNYNENQDTGF
jgi:hypothetical protein